MTVYAKVTYSRHAVQRMRQRRVSQQDVELVLRVGDRVFEDEDGTWTHELGELRVVIVERGDAAHVVTVIRLRKQA